MGKSNNRGTTLVELMIALTVSLLIISSLGAIYLAQQQSQQTQAAIITMIENSRIAKYFLKSAIKNNKNNNNNKPEITHYFVEKTLRKDERGIPIYALYRQEMTARPFKKIELVEGVNKMEINYAVLENHQLVEYPIEKITDWSTVRGVSIKLVFSFFDKMHLEKSEYVYVAL